MWQYYNVPSTNHPFRHPHIKVEIRDSIKNEFCKQLVNKTKIQKCELERISKIALKLERRCFAEVLDYDYLDEIRIKYNPLGLMATMDFINKGLPVSESQIDYMKSYSIYRTSWN